jgi:starch synthase (maltosyl-transferring)
MNQPEEMLVYNIFPLLAGKLRDWEPHLERGAEMGFNWVFVNPIQKPGMSGSLYSIKDYFSFNPLLIEEKSSTKPADQVKAVCRMAKQRGMKMMIDLVINHCAVDSDLIKKHPEWFAWQENGEVAHPTADQDGKTVTWGDLARFDHRHTKDKEGLYQFCSKVVDFLLELGFEGFRCDAAYQLPRKLWERLIQDTKKKHPDARFFAETLGCPPDQTKATAKAGFDYIFNSSKWWDFEAPWLMEQYDLTREICPSISFPESHDTVRLCEELDGNIAGLKQRYLFEALFSAGVMIPMGFELGFRKKPHVVKTRPKDWERTDIDLTDFITKVNEVKRGHAIFQEDADTEVLETENPNILLMWKASSSSPEEALIILNKDIENKQTFHAEKLRDLVKSGAALQDISPEHRRDHIPAPFSHELEPGEGIVLTTPREAHEED